MARMSVDDSFLREPRVLDLAQRVTGWTKHDVRSRLLDVWAVCYDRETPLIPARDADLAAEYLGFAALMLEVGLAKRHRGGKLIHVCGVAERITYLTESRTRGREGGLKSAESRKKTPKGGLNSGGRGGSGPLQGSANPPDPVPDSAPDPVPDSAPDPVPDSAPDPARVPDSVPEPGPAPARDPGTPSGWTVGYTAPEHDLAMVHDPTPIPPLPPTPRELELDPMRRERQRLLREIFPRHVEAYNRVRAQLGHTDTRPMGLVGDPAERAFFERAATYPTVEALRGFADDVLHVLAVREREALEKRTLQHLGVALYGKAFGVALSLRTSTTTLDAPRASPRGVESKPDAFAALLAAATTPKEP